MKSRLKISKFGILMILILMFGDNYKYTVIALCAALVHESGHIIAALILKMKIEEKYNLYIKKESISIEEKQEIIDLYNIYKKFECCDVIADLIKKINSIPIK